MELLRRAPEHQLATLTHEGAPVLRVLNGVLVEGHILFHGSIAGEKSDCLGQAAVVSVHRVVTDVPSYFIDKEKACPATTLYHSAQCKGQLQSYDNLKLKATMLQALMEKLQPEGGHVPLDETEPLYKKDLRSLRVFGFKIEELTGKSSILADRPTERCLKVINGLWKRGRSRDLSAIEEILRFSPAARPIEWTLPGGFRFFVHPTQEQISTHGQLVTGEYWREGISLALIEESISKSSAWVGVENEDGRLVGAARAISDSDWTAQISDVVIASEYRGRALGKRLMELLLDHPMVRHCPHQRLGTRDREQFYRELGFEMSATAEGGIANLPMHRAGSERS